MNQQFLEKHMTLHYIGKCIKHIGDKKFMNFVLEDEKNPSRIIFSCPGNKNPDKNIMIIHNGFPLNGFFAEFKCTLKLLAYADRYAFVPYIIYDDSYIYAEQKEINSTCNPFEYFFKQPSGLSYEEAMSSFNVFDSKTVHSYMVDMKHGIKLSSYDSGETYIDELALMMRKYIHLNERTQEYIGSSITELFEGKGRVLGVHHRGTDYRKEYKRHPKFVTLDEKINHIKKVEKNYDKIFVATDEVQAIDKLQKVFGDKICYYKDVFRGDSDISVAFSASKRENHKYLLGLEVLRDMYTLAQCDGLIAGISQVSLCAQIAKRSMGNKYDFLEIIDNGIVEEGEYFWPGSL